MILNNEAKSYKLNFSDVAKKLLNVTLFLSNEDKMKRLDELEYEFINNAPIAYNN